MKKERKVIAVVLVALVVFLMGFGLGVTKGFKIDVNVNGGSANAAAPAAAAPATTAAPATSAPAATAAPEVSQAPASEPAAPAGGDTTAAPSDNGGAASAMPTSVDDIIAKYNEVINAAKKEQNVTVHKTGNVTLECTDCSAASLTNTVNTALSSLAKPSDHTYTVTGGSATDESGAAADLNSAIAPSGRDCTLSGNHVASATSAAEGDGYKMTITLNAETSTFDGTNTVNPEGHNACLDPLNLATIEIPIPGCKITNADMQYPGATLTATVNGAGKLTRLEVSLPMSGNGTGKIVITSLTVSITGSMDDVYEFTY